MSSWEVRFSRSKSLPYYFNSATQESIWTPPPGLSEEDIKKLPGASQYLAQHPAPAAPAAPSAPEQDGKVRASHLLIKHSGSRRPASWKNPKITMSKEDAITRLSEYEKQLRALQDEDLAREFARIATEESDCASHAKGGDLGWFGRGNMQKPFEDATFGLEPGQMSSIIDTDSGVHLILRTA